MLPNLSSKRLTLRPFQLSDAATVQKLAGNKIIADMTANIPHPYLDGMAEQWISKHPTWFENKQAVALAIELTESSELIGTISITEIHANKGNLGYWIGQPHWSNGYCTEATTAILDYAFNELALDLVYARHLPENPASGKVMTNNGFTYINETPVGERLLKHYELPKAQWKQLK